MWLSRIAFIGTAIYKNTSSIRATERSNGHRDCRSGDNNMSASRAADDGLTFDQLVLDYGVDQAEIMPSLRAEMERVDRYIMDMKDRILPLWSSPHELFPDVAAVLQKWHAAQPDMRAFFASPAYVEVRALRKKYVKLEQVADAVCELMDLERWINGIQLIVCIRTEDPMVCMHKQRTLQQLVPDVSREAGDDVQSSVDRLLTKTRATLALQRRCARVRLDGLAVADEDRAEIASIVDWISEAHQNLYETRWSQMRSNGNALLVLVDIRKAVNRYDELQAKIRDEMPRTE